MTDQKKFFTRHLLQWNKDQNKREMPWKHEKDPYKIWISEIILQQTRVQQGLEYYKRFINKFLNIHCLAAATENEVFKIWEGLGYYTRCRNIIASAKFITEKLNGKFPDKYEDILQLKGVGSYTAAAIASFAYNLPHAVLDGNVFRVLSRYFAITIPIDNGNGKKFYGHLANELLDKKDPGVYNQSIMDFGATICKPLPLCQICPLKRRCVGYLKGFINQLPVKEKAILKTSRWFYYLRVEYNKKFYVRKRIQKDIWQNLFEFILIETKRPVTLKELQKLQDFTTIFKSIPYKIEDISPLYKQTLTHQVISGNFVHISIKSHLRAKKYQLTSLKELQKLPFPKFINTYFRTLKCIKFV